MDVMDITRLIKFWTSVSRALHYAKVDTNNPDKLSREIIYFFHKCLLMETHIKNF